MAMAIDSTMHIRNSDIVARSDVGSFSSGGSDNVLGKDAADESLFFTMDGPW